MTKTKGLPMPALGLPPSSSWWVGLSREKFAAEVHRRERELSASVFGQRSTLVLPEMGDQSMSQRARRDGWKRSQ